LKFHSLIDNLGEYTEIRGKVYALIDHEKFDKQIIATQDSVAISVSPSSFSFESHCQLSLLSSFLDSLFIILLEQSELKADSNSEVRRGIGVVGINFYCLLKTFDCFVIILQFIKDLTLVIPGITVVGIHP
jgi:hypothetical protein